MSQHFNYLTYPLFREDAYGNETVTKLELSYIYESGYSSEEGRWAECELQYAETLGLARTRFELSERETENAELFILENHREFHSA